MTLKIKVSVISDVRFCSVKKKRLGEDNLQRRPLVRFLSKLIFCGAPWWGPTILRADFRTNRLVHRTVCSKSFHSWKFWKVVVFGSNPDSQMENRWEMEGLGDIGAFHRLVKTIQITSSLVVSTLRPIPFFDGQSNLWEYTKRVEHLEITLTFIFKLEWSKVDLAAR